MAHAFEENVKNYCNSVPSKNIKSLAARPYDWKDVVVLLNHKFPTYLDSVATVLDSENKWELLEIKTRFPISKIYL
jgi:hypothetical protein